MKRKILIAAPHLTMPILNGADLYIEKKWGAVSIIDFDVIMVAADGIYHLNDNNSWICRRAYKDTRRSRMFAQVHHLFSPAEYLVSRYHTQAYANILKEFELEFFDIVIASFVSTFSLLSKFKYGRIAIETHNFDPKYYLDRATELSGLKRWVAIRNSKRTEKGLNFLSKDEVLIALGDSDKKCFESMGFNSVLKSSIGYQKKQLRSVWPDSDAIYISFVGSLSASMNEMALREFFKGSYFDLKKVLPVKLVVNVIGSSPSVKFSEFLSSIGVKLFANVSDDELDLILQKSHATFLPFKNNNGLKLKFATAASLGVPVVGFIDPPVELTGCEAVFSAQEMHEWARFLVGLQSNTDAVMNACHQLQTVMSQLSWERVAMNDICSILKDGE